jgi:hypothetical protein
MALKTCFYVAKYVTQREYAAQEKRSGSLRRDLVSKFTTHLARFMFALFGITRQVLSKYKE